MVKSTASKRQRLHVFNGGLLVKARLRRILQLSGYDIRCGLPGPGDRVGVWGQSPTAWRGERIAAMRHAGLLRIEDAFLRSLHPGRSGSAPAGLLLDRTGVHFDGARPSDLETLLRTHPLDDRAMMMRAEAAIHRLRTAHLSKYNAFDPDCPVPGPGYVLVVDQARGDASVTASGGNRAAFRDMLAAARIEHPGAPIIIKAHPETGAGFRCGYFRRDDENAQVSLFDRPASPWRLLEGARAVHTLSSQMGFEAILAGHRPRVFGWPFYAGWGLTEDENPVGRRGRTLSRNQLFAAAMIVYPTWYDPLRDRLCELEDVIALQEAESRVWREDRDGYVACGIRLWKRRHLRTFFGRHRRLKFTTFRAAENTATATNRKVLAWASAAPGLSHGQTRLVRVEDGFLRSCGLGAKLTPPLSLVLDDLGIHYDPGAECRLERLIARRSRMKDGEHARASALIRQLIRAGLSKYNLGGTPPPDLPRGRRILVPGQVEDDASILKGCPGIRSNPELLRITREANPDAVILYKPHPDVEAGLRRGHVEEAQALTWANRILLGCDPAALLEQAEEVWTMTSLLGFEALLRGVRVTCLGVPFYAGWGLTTDGAPTPGRRNTAVSLEGLVHAALIDYPRYIDPLTRKPCPVELMVERLANNRIPPPGAASRSLSKLQGLPGLPAGQGRILRR